MNKKTVRNTVHKWRALGSVETKNQNESAKVRDNTWGAGSKEKICDAIVATERGANKRQ